VSYLLDCPNCGYEVLDGEMRDGQRVVEWQYCDDCGWQSEIDLCRIVEHEWGTARVIDSTFVRPDRALLRSLKGRLNFTPEALANLVIPPSYAWPPPTAPCPQCGRTIQLELEISGDQTAYRAFWLCDVCGFKNGGTSIPAPGLFRHGYRFVSWRGTDHHLTRQQSSMIEILDSYRLKGKPDVPPRQLMREMGVPNSRPRDSFRSRNRELWKTLIIHQKGAPRGTLRLNL